MTIYALGPFRLDTQDGLLLHGSEPVALGRRAIALLRALVERPGALISKDALIKAAWPGQAVEESNLTVQVAALRRVLGEASGGDRWIETMPRRGYRFIGPVVTEVEKGVKAPPPQADAARDPAPTPHDHAERRQITAMSCELVGVAAGADGMGLEDLREAVGGFQRGRSPRRVRRQPSRACRARPFRLSRCTRIRRRRDARGAGQRSATRCGPYSIIVAWQLSAGVVGFMVIFIVYLAGHTTAACCNCSKIGPTV